MRFGICIQLFGIKIKSNKQKLKIKFQLFKTKELRVVQLP